MLVSVILGSQLLCNPLHDAESDSMSVLTVARFKELCQNSLQGRWPDVFTHCPNNFFVRSRSVLRHSDQHMCYVLSTGFSFIKRNGQELLLKQLVQSLNQGCVKYHQEATCEVTHSHLLSCGFLS